MKKILFTLFIASIFISHSEAQTMFGNTALTLSNKTLSIGVNGVYATDLNVIDPTFAPTPQSLAYFFHLGYGTGSSSDIGFNIGKAWGSMYYGFDFEKRFVKEGNFFISGSIGGHYWNRAGGDVDLIASLKINDFYLTSGIDVDVEPYQQTDGQIVVYLPTYVPVTFEFNPNSHMAFTIEANIAVNAPAFTTVGGGVNFYF